jgi:chemotaxis protein methyltransferase CheR
MEHKKQAMEQAASLSARFRHVTFPTDLDRGQKAVNFAAEVVAMTPVGSIGPVLSEAQAAFVRWLFKQAGLDAPAYRAETLKRRLPSCLRGLRVSSVAEAQRLLEAKPHLVADAVSAMLVGVTSFFRDPAVFDALANEFLPECARGRANLHVWSAGSSDGPELYSIGMLFAEKGWLGRSYLLGTDCRLDAIRRAREGLYDTPACKNVPPTLLARYFQAEGDQWRVVPGLRNSLRWRTADLLQVQEPGIWDLILCRNTTMYLRTEATAPLWPRLEALLRPGGLLVLGKAERPLGTKRLTPLGSCMYRRTRG